MSWSWHHTPLQTHSAHARFAHVKAETCLTVPASLLAKLWGKFSATLPQGAHRVTVGAKQCLLECCGRHTWQCPATPSRKVVQGAALKYAALQPPGSTQGPLPGRVSSPKLSDVSDLLSLSLDTLPQCGRRAAGWKQGSSVAGGMPLHELPGMHPEEACALVPIVISQTGCSRWHNQECSDLA